MSKWPFSVHGILSCGLFAVLALAAGPATAHFQELIPSTDNVVADGPRGVTINLLFTHPMAMKPVMEMARPVRFGAVRDGKVEDLLASLVRRKVDGRSTWQARYRFKRPGDYIFFVEPKPYWEPAENKMIIHYTKVVVDAFDYGEGWDRPVGLPVEILPLARPYSLWTGNIFRGVVLKGGKPLPGAEIEVEWINDGSLKLPVPSYETQVIHADANGVFAYGLPRAGWWGFAALTEAEKPMNSPDGKPVSVEQGGLIWVRARDMK